MNAGTTNLNPHQTLEILAGWMLGQINSIRPHNAGSSGAKKFVVESAEGRFLLKGRPVGKLSSERLELIRQITAKCVKARVPIADLRPQADGQRYTEWGGFVGNCRAGSLVEMVGVQATTPFLRELRWQSFTGQRETCRRRRSRDTTSDKTLRKLLDLLFLMRRMPNQPCVTWSRWQKSPE